MSGKGLPGFRGGNRLWLFSPPFFWDPRRLDSPKAMRREGSGRPRRGRMGERAGMGSPSPRDADDGARALGALLWVEESGGGLRGGGGTGAGRGGSRLS